MTEVNQSDVKLTDPEAKQEKEAFISPNDTEKPTAIITPTKVAFSDQNEVHEILKLKK
jgi:hypothetical protein